MTPRPACTRAQVLDRANNANYNAIGYDAPGDRVRGRHPFWCAARAPLLGA